MRGGDLGGTAQSPVPSGLPVHPPHPQPHGRVWESQVLGSSGLGGWHPEFRRCPRLPPSPQSLCGADCRGQKRHVPVPQMLITLQHLPHGLGLGCPPPHLVDQVLWEAGCTGLSSPLKVPTLVGRVPSFLWARATREQVILTAPAAGVRGRPHSGGRALQVQGIRISWSTLSFY